MNSNRASRNGIDSAHLVYIAEREDYNIHLIQDNLLLNRKSKPQDFLIFEIHNCFSNFYPRNLSVDVTTKLREKAEQGYYPERAMVGYMRKPGSKRAYLQINPEKARILKGLLNYTPPVNILIRHLRSNYGTKVFIFRRRLKSENQTLKIF